VHRNREITVFRARIPLLLGTTVCLQDETERAVYVWPFMRLRQTRQALEDAGFVLRERRTWFIAAGLPWSRGREAPDFE
jgi:hypothetical protein